MGTSRNDIYFYGGIARITSKLHKNKHEGKMELINPQTHKPFTNLEILMTLEKRQEENPQLASLIEPWHERFEKLAKVKPDGVFAVYASSKEKADVKEKVKNSRGKELENLARVLFRPMYESNLKYGHLSVNDYVLYTKDSLYIRELPDVRDRLMSCLNNYILPEIGEVKLKELDKERQTKAVKAINRKLRKQGRKKSLFAYVRRAYKGLLESIESSGWKESSAGMRLADIIMQTRERNTAIRGSVRTDHLDDVKRENFFHLLQDPGHLYESFLVGLIYSGMELSEISAACFDDIEVIELPGGEACYTLMVTRLVRKLNKRYSTLGATNDSFPIQKLRRIVLYPWAADVMLKWLEALRNEGYSDDEIREMRLSERRKGYITVGPKELSDILVPLMIQAGIQETVVTRTDKQGKPYRESLPVEVGLLRQDARYMAHYCGAISIMENAMFGDPWKETDEQSYLDLLGERYAVARYYHLRRWSPYPSASVQTSSKNLISGSKQAPGRHVLEISNPNAKPVTLTLSAQFGIRAEWKILKEEHHNEIES